MTFTAPPGDGLPVAVVMVPLRLVRLTEAAEFDSSEDEGVARVRLVLEEQVRPAGAAGRVYFGDLPLWRDALDAPQESPNRRLLQKFQGVARQTRAYSARSPNWGLSLEVTCLGMPNLAERTARGWLALSRAVRRALWERSEATAPVVWVDDVASDRELSRGDGGRIHNNGGPWTRGWGRAPGAPLWRGQVAAG